MSIAGSPDGVNDNLAAAPEQRTASRLRRVAVGLLAGVVLWGLHKAYRANLPWAFFGCGGGLLAMTAIWLWSESRQVSQIGWMAWQRCAAAWLMLAVVEIGYRLPAHMGVLSRESAAEASWKAVSFAEAKDDPVAYARWWKAYQAEWYKDPEQILTFTPSGPVPYLFKPNTSRPFFQGTIRINSLGLADRERDLDKGDKFRVVVMGSSHSQGLPLEAGDTPWPEKLERLIHERVPGGERIEVLNAGAGAHTMENNLHRLKTVVLPLRPDLIITYFGANEYHWFRREFALPKIPPSPTGQRSSTLIKKLDDRYASWWASLGNDPAPIEDYGPLAARMKSCRVARCYEEYFRIARQAGIPVVVCNFSMAVDERTPPEVIEFYRSSFPNVKFMREANRLNTALLPLVVRPETGARLIDVQNGLNGGGDELFVDLIHPSDLGHARLAENVLRGMIDLLPASSPTPTETPPSRLVERPEPNTSHN